MFVASTFRRTIAHLSDEMISAFFLLPVIVSVWSQMSKDHDIVVPWRLLISVVAARICYEIICVYALQALPAQRFFGLKIVSTYHPEFGVSLWQATIRVLIGQLKYILGPSIYFMALFHRDRQHLGDILSETRVVQLHERSFTPKARYVLGAILVYSSLVMNLHETVNLVRQRPFNKNGIRIEVPNFNIKLEGIP